MSDLASFQQGFARALVSEEQPVPQFRSVAFAVYRNTSARGAVEALRASYPTIDLLLGPDMFTDVALDYRRAKPPSSPVLSDYGADFPAWLGNQPWTSELPYVADVALLDRLWLESFLAAAPGPQTRVINSASRISLHPAARFAWLSTPAFTIWQAHRGAEELDELEPEWCEEGALFTRPGLEVRYEPIDPASHRLLAACAVPASIEDCVADVAAEFPAADVPALLMRLVASGALIIQN